MTCRTTLLITILSGTAIMGLVGCRDSDSQSLVTPSPVVTPSPAPSPSPAPEVERPFQDGLDMGLSAANAAQIAASQDDWNLVTSRWQRAIALLESVPQSNPNYATAQEKLVEYQRNLAIAQQRAQQAPVEGRPTSVISQDDPSSTETASAFELCQSASPTGAPEPLEITNPGFQADEFNPAQDDIVGCLTNHGDRPISQARLTYSYSDDDGGGTGGGVSDLEFPTDVIQAGQTIPFRTVVPFDRSGIEPDQDIPPVEIVSISWCWQDDEACNISSTPNSTALSLVVNR
ncbi:MAG TPA: hypothetical protein ACFE0H_04225 [Elainellaceae cyanobacterium]